MKEIKLTADDFFRANQREFMDSLEPEKRDLMICLERRSEPECCNECGFFRIVKGTGDGGIRMECAIDADIRITDGLERQFSCPL